ncbi:MAG: lipid A biosynthesis lauroyl acyltransferase [Gammaproteobacteria bacterium]|nr:lipid A biosynthesis lauroyl acyltransferase [Gammaproteobacteria bacterium]
MNISNFLVWLVAGILWLIVQLPYRIQLYIGKYLGLMGYYFAKREYHNADINLQKCFPELDAKTRKKLIRENFISAGQGTLETLLGFWGSPKRLKKLIHIKNLSYIKEALKNKNGVIVFGPHFTSVHFAGRLLNLEHPFSVMYFPPKNNVFRKITERALPHCYDRAIPRDDARALIRALKENKAVLYTPDVDAGPKGLFVPFFNILASTVTATSRFAALTGCAVIEVRYHRRTDKTGIDIEFQQPLDNFPSQDEYQDTLHINHFLENQIREFPEQYLWQYKRFKTRPKGEKDFYAKSTLVS